MAQVIVGHFTSRLEAELAVEVLEESGISAEVFADDAGGTIPSLQAAEGAVVRVASSDAERAEHLLRDFADKAPEPQPALTKTQRVQSVVIGFMLALLLLLFVIYYAMTIPAAS